MNLFRWINSTGDSRGFSLIELLIAMVVLAIGILATMAMQFSALAGYSNARDASQATELARTVEQVIQAEARAWTMDQSSDAVSQHAYTDQPAYFQEAFDDTEDGWVTVHDEPVTLRSTDDSPRRFCVYVAAEEFDDGTVDGSQGFARVAIAVVYPAGRSTFAEWGHQCPDDETSAENGEVLIDSTQREQLELAGLRAVHLTTSVQAAPEN